MQKLKIRDSTAGMGHTLKMALLMILRNPVLNLILNLVMFLINGVTCASQFFLGNYILGNILLISTISCLSAVAYWSFFVWDRRNDTKSK